MGFTLSIEVIVVVGVVGAVGAYAIGSYLIGLWTQPQVAMTWDGAYAGTCTPTYTLFWQTGWTRQVTANVTLQNTGPSNGQATITFTEDGSSAHTQDYFIGSGKTQVVSAQFTVNDCNTHQYGAYISGVKQA